MKKIITLLALTFMISSCSNQLVSVKDPSLTPYQYHQPLIIIENFYTNQNGFNKFFNDKINAHERVASINKKLIEKLKPQLSTNNKTVNYFTVNVNIDQELVLNPSDVDQQINQEINQQIQQNNNDLVINITAQNIHREFKNNLSPGVVIGTNNQVGMNVSSSATNLIYTYVITAVDTKTQKEVWKAKYDVRNADDFLVNYPKRIAKLLTAKIKEDQLF